MTSLSDMDLISDAIIDTCMDPVRNEFVKKGNSNSKGKRNEKEGTTCNISGNLLAAELILEDTFITEDEKSTPDALSGVVNRSEKYTVRNKRPQPHYDDTVPQHVKLFKKIMYYISLCAKPFGISISYLWVPKKHIMWWFTVFVIIYTWFCIFYTQAIHINNGDKLRVLEACAIYGIASSCTQKIFGYLKSRIDTVTLLMHIREICLQNEAGRRADIINSRLCKTFTFLKVFFVGVMSSMAMFLFYPIKKFIADGELISLLPLEIIFVDQSMLLGYAIANIIMAVMGAMAALGSVLYGAVFVFCIRNYTMQVELIVQDFKDLDEMWTNKTRISVLCKRTYLRNICVKREDLKRYMDLIKKICERKFFYYFCFNYFSQIICLFEITKVICNSLIKYLYTTLGRK